MKEIIKASFFNNIQRVRDLTQLHLALLAFPAQNSILYSEDVLRASIVLMHATLEDLLRGLFKWKIPEKGVEQWNKIPLIGISDRNQPKNFLLGNLQAHRSKTIEELFLLSVDEYLNYTNYNKVPDIDILFKDVGIESKSFDEFYGLLGEMMERRHNIVHRADREHPLDANGSSLARIEYTTVVAYLENLVGFGERVFEKVSDS
jgi:hypothetical protein